MSSSFKSSGEPKYCGTPEAATACSHKIVTALLSQGIEFALIIIHDGLIETALQFFQRHPSRLRRRFGIVDTVRRVGKSSFQNVPSSTERAFRPFLLPMARTGGLLRDDAKPIYQD